MKSLLFNKNDEGAESVTLQDVLFQSLEQDGERSQIWSTMHQKLDFPKCRDLYISPVFKFGENEKLSFENLIEEVAGNSDKRLHVLFANPGMGKSRCAQELQSRLVSRLEDHLVLFLSLIATDSFLQQWVEENQDSYGSLLKKFLGECLDKRRAEEFDEKLQKGKVFVVLDGFDEISNYSRVALGLMNCLLEKGARILVTTRTHALDTIKNFQNAVAYELLEFSQEKSLLYLQTRLHKNEKECDEIMGSFASGFGAIPLHLKMFCDVIKSGEWQIGGNLYQLYSKYVEIKVGNGIKQIFKIQCQSSLYRENRKKIEDLLAKHALNETLSKKKAKLDEEDVKLINVSGIASVADTESQINFVHYTFTEFHFAKAIVDVNFDPESEFTKSIFCSYAVQGYIAAFCGVEGNVTRQMKINLKTLLNCEDGLEFVCKFGLVNIFKFIQFGTASLQKWAFRSRFASLSGYCLKEAPFFKACASNPELAEKLCAFLEEEHFPDFQDLLRGFRGRIPEKLLQIILSKFPGWSEKVNTKLLATVLHPKNRETLIKEMSEEALENVLEDFRWVKIVDTTLEQKRAILINLLNIKGFSSDQEDLCEVWLKVAIGNLVLKYCSEVSNNEFVPNDILLKKREEFFEVALCELEEIQDLPLIQKTLKDLKEVKPFNHFIETFLIRPILEITWYPEIGKFLQPISEMFPRYLLSGRNCRSLDSRYRVCKTMSY
jgi:hypothetical protein